MNVNVDLIGENVIEINGGKMINVDMKVKKYYVCEERLCLESFYMFL